MGLRLKKVVTEKQVTKAWQELLQSGCQMETEEGQPLRVIYPGKNSDAPGSDFQDAVINVGRDTIKGNIEVHIDASGWRSHRHHLDPAYNNVVLHVALQRDGTGDVLRQNGDLIPAVIIGKYFSRETRNKTSAPVPCAGMAWDTPDKLTGIIDTAGAARFTEKATQFKQQLHQQAAGQCLYTGVMAALGYARNQEPFRELAGRVPLSALESGVDRKNEAGRSLIYQQARLLGTAGFLPSQRPECEYSPWEDYAYVEKLETVWKTIKQPDVMDFNAWQPFRVRPANSPLRRIAGMCRLIQRYRGKGLLRGLAEPVMEVTAAKGCHALEEGLLAADDSYWAGRYDFGKGYPGLSKWLIGQSRAADVVINVLLPFVYAWGEENGQKELAEKAYALYLSYPAVESNTIERHMRTQLGLENAQVNSASRQQGLLHLYKRWCTQGRCGECEVVKG